MKQRPILFTAPMVRAILDGSKTQTRRIVKPRKDRDMGCELAQHELAGEVNAGNYRNCQYGQPGDRLWVRETWQGPLLDEEQMIDRQENGPEAFQRAEFCAYRATDELDAIDEDGNELGWRPSIHMPRWASRITLEITGVRVERLQEISEADAVAEGCEEEFGHAADCMSDDCALAAGYDDCAGNLTTAKENYQLLWDSINGAGSWDANPWVWVVEFRRIEQ